MIRDQLQTCCGEGNCCFRVPCPHSQAPAHPPRSPSGLTPLANRMGTGATRHRKRGDSTCCPTRTDARCTGPRLLIPPLRRVGSVSRCFPPAPSPFCPAHPAAWRAAGAALDGCSVAAEAPPAAVSAAVPAAPGEAAGTGRALPTPQLLAALQGGQRTHSAMKS